MGRLGRSLRSSVRATAVVVGRWDFAGSDAEFIEYNRSRGYSAPSFECVINCDRSAPKPNGVGRLVVLAAVPRLLVADERAATSSARRSPPADLRRGRPFPERLHRRAGRCRVCATPRCRPVRRDLRRRAGRRRAGRELGRGNRDDAATSPAATAQACGGERPRRHVPAAATGHRPRPLCGADERPGAAGAEHATIPATATSISRSATARTTTKRDAGSTARLQRQLGRRPDRERQGREA